MKYKILCENIQDVHKMYCSQKDTCVACALREETNKKGLTACKDFVDQYEECAAEVMGVETVSGESAIAQECAKLESEIRQYKQDIMVYQRLLREETDKAAQREKAIDVALYVLESAEPERRTR